MKSQRPSLHVEVRKIVGRKVKKLRREGKVPANVFGKKVKSASVSIDAVSFGKLFRKVGETTLVDLVVAGEKEARPVLVTDVQRDPVTDHIIHVDFHQVDLTEKVTADIPVRIIGESLAVKDKGAVLVTVLSSIPVEALPSDLPDHIDADISGLVEFGNSIHVKDVTVDRAKVTLMIGDEETVATVQEPKTEVEEAPAAPVTAEGAPTTEGEAAPAEPADAKAMAGKGEKKAEAPKTDSGKTKEPSKNEEKK